MPSYLSLTRVLIGINVVVYCLQSLTGDQLLYFFAL